MDKTLTKEEAQLLYQMCAGAIEQFQASSLSPEEQRDIREMVVRMQAIQIKLAAMVNVDG